MTQKRVGIWIRVSDEDSAKGDSPIVHEKRARTYAEMKGYKVIEMYDLSGISGKTVKDTPQGKQMLYDIQRGHIEGLIFSKIARFARNTRELLDFADYFRNHNADLISLEESFDTSTPAGRLFYTFLSAIAEWEREEIVSRINSSIKVRSKMGRRLGGKVPFGYDWDGHELVLNEEEAIIRKLIYTLFLQEKRKKTVAKILNERGYRTRKGGKFYDTNVKRWLRDPLSKGVRRSNFTKKVLVDGKMQVEYKDENEWHFHTAPAIVSEELWQQANDILDEQEKNRTKPLNRRTHIFTRYIYCGCESRMSVHSGNDFYRCNKKGCNNKIRRTVIEDIYKEQLLAYVQSEDKVAEYLSVSNNELQEKEHLLSNRKKKQKELALKIEKIIDLHVEGQISKEAFKQHHDKPYNQLQAVEQEILTLESEIKLVTMQKDSVDVVMSEATNLYTNWDSFSQSEKRRLVEMITERIVIGTDDSINIELYRLMPDGQFSELGTNGQRNLLGRQKL